MESLRLRRGRRGEIGDSNIEGGCPFRFDPELDWARAAGRMIGLVRRRLGAPRLLFALRQTLSDLSSFHVYPVPEL